MHGTTQGNGAGLSDRERKVLALERGWWKYAATRTEAIREQVGMGWSEYHPFLNALLDRPEAMEHDPLLVKRLRRLRSTRRGAGNVGRGRAAR